MTLTVKEIVKQNNEKRKLLTTENETYYENMLVYIRTNDFRNERATEEVLLEMLDHLLEAQKHGKTAEEVFGKSPQQLAEEIIESLPKESIKSMAEFWAETIMMLFGWYLVVSGIFPLMTKQDQTVYLGTLIVSTILLLGSLFLLLYLIFVVIKKNSFADRKKKKRVSWLIGLLICSLFIGSFVAHLFMKPFGTPMQISYYTGFGLGCFFLLASYLLKKMREAK